MTGALGLLGAPRQRSASNLSVARQARPSGSVMKITLLSCSSLLGLRLPPYSRTPPAHSFCIRQRGIIPLYLVGREAGRLRRCLCTIGLPQHLLFSLVRCLTNLRIVAALPITRRRPKSIWPGSGLVWTSPSNARRRCRRGVRFWQLRPDAPIAPARWSLRRPLQQQHTLCNAPAPGCHHRIDSPDLVLVQLLVLTSHQGPRPKDQPHTRNTTYFVACWFAQRPIAQCTQLTIFFPLAQAVNTSPLSACECH